MVAVLAVVVLAAATGPADPSSAGVRPPSFSLVVGLVAACVIAAGVVVLVSLLRTLERGELKDRHQTVRDLIRLLLIFVLAVVLFRILPENNEGGSGVTEPATPTSIDQPFVPASSGVDWVLLVVVAGVAAVVGWRSWRGRRAAERDVRADGDPMAGEVAEVLDDVIERLRSERDPRRAVIAAYARMEDVFARHGSPRRPSEAPLEFLARALEQVAEAGPARRLTDLFERAMFSTQPFDRVVQDEAIDALVAVRDDLRHRADTARAGTIR